MTGWSVSTNISLVRDDDDIKAESNVGELLKRKAEEGVQVFVVVWDERTSNALNEGKMIMMTIMMMMTMIMMMTMMMMMMMEIITVRIL